MRLCRIAKGIEVIENEIDIMGKRKRFIFRHLLGSLSLIV
jgi:hypothetical protein